MGRELSVDRIDFMKDGQIIIGNCPDYYVCGRNDFSNHIASLFYKTGKEVSFLLVDYDGKLDENNRATIHVKTEGGYWDEKEFDMEFSTIDLETVKEICNDYMEKDTKELERENAMLNDAYCARRNTTTVKDFTEFSDLIDDLQEHIDDFREHARLYWKYVSALNLCFDERTTEKTYILLTLSE